VAKRAKAAAGGRRDPEATMVSAVSPGHLLDISVVLLSGEARGTAFPLRGRLRVGKAADNDVVIADESVSRHHCEIAPAETGVRVTDLDSTNGTFVEGTRVTEAVACVGSVLRAGDVRLALRPSLDAFGLAKLPHAELEGVVGKSEEVRRVCAVLAGIARTDATVLLTGETGTGKEVLARALALASGRGAPFVVVDCGAITPTLVASELFGHERGAFTGAVSDRKGAFELARGGTLFLDEVGELPLDVQPSLLRVLESREFRRVGGSQTLTADVRIVAATNRDLEREVSAGKFREDLYFRLAVVPVAVPPLRARREDIPDLVAHFLARTKGGRALEVGPKTLDWLMAHDWPGNIRELRNLVERAAYMAIAAGSDELALPSAPASSRGEAAALFRFSLGEAYRDARARVEREFERRYVAWLLAAHDGNLSAAARTADVDRKHLHVLAHKHGLRRARSSRER
jgi:transcriptional regulator with GAF, ATPase, and Fis domain